MSWQWTDRRKSWHVSPRDILGKALGRDPRDWVEYESAEDGAAADQIGLWQDKNPVPAWEWRKAH